MKTNGKSQGIRLEISKEWVLSLVIVLLALLWLGLVAATWGDSAEAAETSGSSSSAKSDDEYSFDWLDPDKKIYVLQNRRYTKANHVMASIMTGIGISNPYRNTYNLDGRLAYYLTEQWGIEGFYTATANAINNTYENLTDTHTPVVPVIREIRDQYGALVHWVPWYAKINVFNEILYFDWYFTAGIGDVHAQVNVNTNPLAAASFVDQDFTGFFFGTGHMYHISDNWTVRLDFTGAAYNAPILGTTGNNSWYTNLNFGIGIGYRL